MYFDSDVCKLHCKVHCHANPIANCSILLTLQGTARNVESSLLRLNLQGTARTEMLDLEDDICRSHDLSFHLVL